MTQGAVSPDADIPLSLHAEFLPNIRQITLHISLPQRIALDGVLSEIQLSESRRELTVSFPHPISHVTGTIQLPALVSDEARRTFNINKASAADNGNTEISESNCEFSVRLQVAANEPALEPWDELIDGYVPWIASDMSSTTRIRCRICGSHFLKDVNNVIDQGRLDWAWKDLPCGNWAEMMEFWHCHKPDPHQVESKVEATAALRTEDQNAQIKGYGASSRVEATPGDILIDAATFLLAESDCVGLEKVRSSSHHNFSDRCLETQSFRIYPLAFLLLWDWAIKKETISTSMGWFPIQLP